MPDETTAPGPARQEPAPIDLAVLHVIYSDGHVEHHHLPPHVAALAIAEERARRQAVRAADELARLGAGDGEGGAGETGTGAHSAAPCDHGPEFRCFDCATDDELLAAVPPLVEGSGS